MNKNKTTLATTLATTFLAITLLMMPATSAHATLIEPVCDDDGEGVQICKEAETNPDFSEEDPFLVGEVIEFEFAITVHTSSTTLINVVVQDRLGGDLDGDNLDLTMAPSLDCDLESPILENNPHGKKKGGNTEKEFLDCEATEIPDNSWETIKFTATTDVNPGQKGKSPPKNEYTSCGEHEVNSGATLQYWLLGQNPLVDLPTILKTPSITVDVFDAEYPVETDCDGDGLYDIEDELPFDFDDDGYNGLDDNCPYTANDQTDTDMDGKGDACDNAPNDFNPNQKDGDEDGVGDVADSCLDVFGLGPDGCPI